jgi:hypothetical protein
MGGLRCFLENPLALGSDPDLKPVILCRTHVLTMAVRNLDVKWRGGPYVSDLQSSSWTSVAAASWFRLHV